MTPGRPLRRRSDAWLAGAGLAATGLAATVASTGTVGDLERRAFLLVNGWPELLRAPLWVGQLPGVLGVPLLVAAGALATRRYRLAVALLLLVPAKLAGEHLVLKSLVQRERPGTTIPEAILRDVPSAGLAFPSGHAIIAFGLVALLAPYLSRRWLGVVLALSVLGSVARIYLGGHAPLDVLGGAAAGLAIGALLNLLVGVEPSEHEPAAAGTDPVSPGGGSAAAGRPGPRPGPRPPRRPGGAGRSRTTRR